MTTPTLPGFLNWSFELLIWIDSCRTTCVPAGITKLGDTEWIDLLLIIACDALLPEGQV